MTGKGLSKIIIVIALVTLFIGSVAFADVTQNGGSVTLVNPLGSSCSDLSCVTTKVINFLFTVSIPLCGILVLVGGFQMMTAAGDPEKFSKGKKTLIYAAIGFIVILMAGSVAALIQGIFTT